MRLLDALENLSETTQQAILNEQSRRFRISDEQPLALHLTNPQLLRQVWEQAEEPERNVIRSFLFTATRGFFRRKEWERLVSRDALLQAGLTRLRRLGIVLTVRKMWSEIGYLMPQEIREQFTLLLLPEPQTAFVTPDSTLPYYSTAGRGGHLDLFGLLLYVRNNPVSLTQKGAIHRRYRQKMAPLLSLSDEHVEGISLPPLDQEERSGLALTIALDIAWKLGLLRRAERTVVLDERRVHDWLHEAPEERWWGMYELVQQHYLPHGEWWDALACLMKQVPPGQWCSLQAQLRMLRDTGFAVPDLMQAVERTRREWLHLLLGLGWVELGEAQSGDVWWRWNPLSRDAEEGGWYIDSAGEITIPPLVPLAAIWQISSVCPLEFDGPLIKGHLQAKTVQAFFSRGGTAEQVIGWLRAGCLHPVPTSVVELIEQWERGTTHIQLEPVYLVRTAHHGLLDEWKEIADFQPYLTRVISPSECLVSVSQHTALVELLRRYGYEPHVLHPTADTPRQQQDREENFSMEQAGLFCVERPWDGYAVENTFPEQTEAMPQIAALPKIWTQHFQSYHPQSLRDLLKRAGELRLEVDIESVDQTRVRGVPAGLRIEMGYWVVTLDSQGGKQHFRLETIHRVRIVVPDYLYEGKGT
ncbi:hypothetical protein ACAF76_012820 [Brevibacillus sp. TJ4]|uniref:hypothetical protein n=1 Tax=Brevibacillus sp. TJ4 TaxID=3234853 RepID=UPI0037D5DF18